MWKPFAGPTHPARWSCMAQVPWQGWNLAGPCVVTCVERSQGIHEQLLMRDRLLCGRLCIANLPGKRHTVAVSDSPAGALSG